MIGMLQGVGHYICLWIGQKFLSPVDAAGSTETIGKDSSLLSMTGCYLCLEIEKEMVMGISLLTCQGETASADSICPYSSWRN